MLVVGAAVSIVQLKRRRGLVDVAGGVDRADLERMGAVAQVRVALRRAAAPPVRGLGRVDPALERGDAGAAGVAAREGEAGGGGVAQRRRAGVDVRVRRGGVDRPAEGGRGLVDVAGGVDRPDLEGMGAVGECGIGLRRGAGGKRRAVAAALEGGDAGAAGVAPREGEVGGGRSLSAGGLESMFVVGAAVSTVQLNDAGVGRRCRRCRSPAPRRNGRRRRVRHRPAARCRGRTLRRRGGTRTRRRRSRRRRCPRRRSWRRRRCSAPAGWSRCWWSARRCRSVQLKEAGVWSTLPAVSIARTSKEWAPSASAA